MHLCCHCHDTYHDGVFDPRAAEARTYYVATSGDDNHSGEEVQPLRTIKTADLARAGDAILVHSGIYSEAVVLRFSGQAGKPIILK